MQGRHRRGWYNCLLTEQKSPAATSNKVFVHSNVLLGYLYRQQASKQQENVVYEGYVEGQIPTNHYRFALRCVALLCSALLCFTLLCCALICVAFLCVALFCVALICFDLLCFAVICFALLCFALI